MNLLCSNRCVFLQLLFSDNYNGDTRLPHPQESTNTQDPRDRAVSVKFTESGQNVIVTYLSHGIA